MNNVHPFRPPRTTGARRWPALVVMGLLGALLPVVPALPTSTVHAQQIYVVTNTSGDAAVANSLPWALMQANYATPQQFDRIMFNIPGPGPHEIKITQTLFVNDKTHIDGRTQPGYSGEPIIWITGGATVPSLVLFHSDPSREHTSSGSTLQGLGLTHYTANAVTILQSSQGNWIQDNWIGFRPMPDGSVQRNVDSGLPGARTTRGVAMASSFNVIRNNTISGVDNGVVIGDPTQFGAPYRTNSVRENRIGTDPTGTTTVGYRNIGDGIFLGPGAQENWLGPANVISGNDSAGVELLHPSNQGNVVFRNMIGLDATGTVRLGNGELGVLMANGAFFNAIGGPFGGNHIAGNTLGGVSIGTSEFGGSHTIWVQYNVIGLGTNGVVIGGQAVGVAVTAGSRAVVVEENVIGGHGEHGVIVGDTRVTTTRGNAVRNNHLGRTASGEARENGGFGIMFLNAGYNWATGNIFGANRLGTIGVQNSPGLAIS